MNFLTLLLSFLVAVGPEMLIPKPVSATVEDGTLVLKEDGSDIIVRLPDRQLKKAVKDLPGFARDEAYRLRITPRGVEIGAMTGTGVLRARQTLEYLRASSGDGTLACCTIVDWPRYSHRGLMMDLSRHFRDKDFILKQLDAMALMKMNVLHLHLTDDAGWRLQTVSAPRLTSLGAWRDGETWTQWQERGRKYLEEGMPGASGGYLTRDEAREIVAYASARGITVIPEIEMPGHSAEVLRAYPALCCMGPDGQPVFSSEVCPGKEETFTFFQRILDEVMEIFPSTFIHIGGDEAEKDHWAECPDCRRRMEEEGLSDVEQLQSYLIRRMERYLSARGRRLMGWDEIMEGGLAPGATVMSWRGTEQGAEAAAMGHDVVMSPGKYCYINRCQDNPVLFPQTVGNYLPLERVYSFDPQEDVEPGAVGHILGLQANEWAEHIPTEERHDYQCFPRLFAIAEVGWSPADGRNYPEFRNRCLNLVEVLKKRGYHPFELSEEIGERPESQSELQHLARGARVLYGTPYSPKYPALGDASLTDGVRGGWAYGGGDWQGFNSDLDVTVDLGRVQPVHYVGTTFLSDPEAWIHLPDRLEVELSDDGISYRKAFSVLREIRDESGMYVLYGGPVTDSARYVRLRAFRASLLHHDWLFVDELVVN